MTINTLLTTPDVCEFARYDSNGRLYFSYPGFIKYYYNNITTNVAGNGTLGFSGDGGLASSAQVGTCRGINFDSAGNIYFADINYSVIRKIDIVSGIITTIAGTGGTSGNTGIGGQAKSALLFGPHDLIFDSNNNMYFSDRQNNRIDKIDTNGVITTITGTGTSGYTGDGGQASLAAVYQPTQLFLNETTKTLYFLDSLNNVARKIDLTSGIITTFAGTGVSSSTGDGGQATLATFNTTRGMVLDIAGNIYISDNTKIRKVDTNGFITTVVGTGASGNTGDGGLPTSATLTYVYYLTFDSNHNLIISDYSGRRVRVVSGL